jgi:hypothetical protein
MRFSPRFFLRSLFVLSMAWVSLPISAAAQVSAEAVSDSALFGRFSPGQQAGIYPTLDAETKSRLWRQHLDLYLEKHPELSARQWTVVQETRDLLAPALFADLRWPESSESRRAREPLLELSVRARELFTQEEWAECFGAGPATAPPA